MTETAVQADFMNWDLTSYFPEFDGDEYRAHRDSLENSLEQLGEDARKLGRIKTDNVDGWAALLVREEDIIREYSHLASYVGCLNSDDATNEAYKSEQARLAGIGALFEKAVVPITAALREVDDTAFDALAGHADLAQRDDVARIGPGHERDHGTHVDDPRRDRR